MLRESKSHAPNSGQQACPQRLRCARCFQRTLWWDAGHRNTGSHGANGTEGPQFHLKPGGSVPTGLGTDRGFFIPSPGAGVSLKTPQLLFFKIPVGF